MQQKQQEKTNYTLKRMGAIFNDGVCFLPLLTRKMLLIGLVYQRKKPAEKNKTTTYL